LLRSADVKLRVNADVLGGEAAAEPWCAWGLSLRLGIFRDGREYGLGSCVGLGALDLGLGGEDVGDVDFWLL
jgi:hypothetical protein